MSDLLNTNCNIYPTPHEFNHVQHVDKSDSVSAILPIYFMKSFLIGFS